MGTSGRLEGRTAVVTGGGSGIGRATAGRLAQEGAFVVVCDIRADPAAETVKEIVERGGEADFRVGDVRDPSFVDQVVADLVADRGRLDILHNNAGASVAKGPLLSVSDDAWRQDIELNLSAFFYGVRAALRVMVPRGRGSIINTSSAAGHAAVAGTAAYGSAKAGVLQLTRTAAIEYARTGVRINAVLPGTISTPNFTSVLSDPQMLADYAAQLPTGRLGQPSEVAEAVLWLASDDSSYVTGATIAVDGGVSAALLSPKLDLGKH
jgi:NAD(P)-dependent dehydrogenase (short-subunit alcohol dehydrogenase family)